jgi:pimeloyl-ACP methyl ester carboxylesterase
LCHYPRMPAGPERLFLPGWGASARLYEAGLPKGWQALEPPTFATSEGSFEVFRRWLVDELDRRPAGVQLAGHSMGGALAIAAAASRPGRVKSLLLITPAGVPLPKPMIYSLRDFVVQAFGGRYPRADALRACREVLRAPRSAFRIARAVHRADLSAEMEVVREAGIPTTVVGCSSDTLVPPRLCRRASKLLGSRYVELPVPGGHMWMLGEWPRFLRLLAQS